MKGRIKLNDALSVERSKPMDNATSRSKSRRDRTWELDHVKGGFGRMGGAQANGRRILRPLRPATCASPGH